MLEKIEKSRDCSIYKYNSEETNGINCYITSTPETRAISNDPMVMGIEYTKKLQDSCTKIIKSLQEKELINLKESESIIFNILRGGLNFGLRESLYDAFNWNMHGCSFISAQRARKDDSPEEWHIVETEYSKVYMPETASILIGDVVATGTSLEHGIDALVKETKKQGSSLKSILFFTFGGTRAAEILRKTDKICREIFPEYENTTLIYLEGCFTVPDQETPLSVKITGTDLVRLNSVMAPDFIESQYEHPSYPIQRCVIYDAGSRAFWTPEYLSDLNGYWSELLEMAENGLEYKELLKERFPEIDPEKIGSADLKEICLEQLKNVKNLM